MNRPLPIRKIIIWWLNNLNFELIVYFKVKRSLINITVDQYGFRPGKSTVIIIALYSLLLYLRLFSSIIVKLMEFM